MPGIFSYLLLILLFSINIFPQGIENLRWISGCWSLSKNEKTITEQWMKPEGKTMIGMSRTVKNNKTVEYEFLRIVEDDKGDIFYIANPSGQQETSFKLISSDSASAVFENPEHDFPNRIIYMLSADGSLNASIEGNINGKERRMEFPLKKISCN